MLGEIVSGLSIFDWLSKFWQKNFHKTPESVAARFCRLFEEHGVHRNQIPRFFGHGLTIADVESDITLLPKLSEEILDEACEMFAVRREWLDGAETQIYQCHDFYKKPADFEMFLDELIKNSSRQEIIGVVVKAKEQNRHSNAVILLQETIGYIGERAIYCYHLINYENPNYWKSRVYHTACVAIAWKNRVYIHGIELPDEMIEQFASGEFLFGWNGEGIWSLGHVHWYPEDMATSPEKLLEGVNPEEHNFGLKSAITLWLKLAQEGYMDNGYSENSSEKFVAALENLNNSD